MANQTAAARDRTPPQGVSPSARTSVTEEFEQREMAALTARSRNACPSHHSAVIDRANADALRAQSD